jgi:hypothetical protein
MSAGVIESLIYRSKNEILKCKNEIFEITIKFVDISDRIEDVKRMINLQENSLYKNNKITSRLRNLYIHLSNERNDARQEILNLKYKLDKLKQKLKEEKELLE